MHVSLTPLQAYNIMFKLFEDFYKKTKSDDIGSLLGIMCFFPDGNTADPAIWHDWKKAIEQKKTLSAQEAFDGMINFLDIYYSFTSSEDAKSILDEMRLAESCGDAQVSIVSLWNSFFKQVLREPKGSREYLMPSEE